MLKTLLLAIESELQHQVARLSAPKYEVFHEMLTYHMGWTGEGSGLAAQGKRIRPLLLLLTCAASGGDWRSALPASACVELVHNFSLVHDDIQDNSDERHGRKTVWALWGMPQGINVGDALFVLSNQALFDLTPAYPPEIVLQAASILQNTCLNLTRGQFLDMTYEKQSRISLEDYWTMISGKTAALITACCAIGSLLGGADGETQDAYTNYAHYLGLAFQVQDDYLGIWGDPSLTGKSISTDLVTGKKTLPVLYGLAKNGAFANRWSSGPVKDEDVDAIANQLAHEGVKLLTQQVVDQLTDQAMHYLRVAGAQGEFGDALFEISNKLLNRQI